MSGRSSSGWRRLVRDVDIFPTRENKGDRVGTERRTAQVRAAGARWLGTQAERELGRGEQRQRGCLEEKQVVLGLSWDVALSGSNDVHAAKR
jgi:hypothetical protein